MKILVVALSLLAGSAFARTVELNSENTNLSAIGQSRGQAAFERVEVVRTAATPEKVTVRYTVKQGDTVCTRFETRRVWVPGGRYGYPRGGTVCRRTPTGTVCRRTGGWGGYPGPGYPGGYYRTERYCVEYGYKLFTEAKKLKLNFKKARKLAQGEREVFNIEFDQRDLDGAKVDYVGNVVEADVNYKIKFSTFLRPDTLKFIAK